ncbi:hypothetical protein QCA50_001384 [Cerrena zonata]|uniref:Uncharacterized protein n=1 Tax=Cerrena zonata TaxID=2478898 RepID=A0AAW0GT46_9APHY
MSLRTAFASVNTRIVFASRSRAFHASPVAAKTATEKVKEVADQVNKTLGQKLAAGIEKGEELTEKTKETVGVAKEKTKETSEVVGQKANQAAAGARQGTEDFKKEVRK